MKHTIVLLVVVITLLAALVLSTGPQFNYFEDGSWQIVGCVSDGLCQD
jgi:hypothetical protein